jgi:hypothetical protein
MTKGAECSLSEQQVCVAQLLLLGADDGRSTVAGVGVFDICNHAIRRVLLHQYGKAQRMLGQHERRQWRKEDDAGEVIWSRAVKTLHLRPTSQATAHTA